jgi:hypothetical protein
MALGIIDIMHVQDFFWCIWDQKKILEGLIYEKL